jgi:lysophospholipase L1-like esterase
MAVGRGSGAGRLAFLVALLAIRAGSAHAADEILVLGDSWGFATAPALQQVLGENGHANVSVVNEAVPGDTAANLSGPVGLQGISGDLAAHPDTVLVHLSIGGNDFLGSWSASLPPQQEEALFDGIVTDIETIVLHIGSERPDVSILLPSYDYPRPLPHGTPLEVNTAAEELASRVQLLAASIPGATFENSNGLMQVHFGFPTLGIPPFDPTLPRLDLPGPEEAFSDSIHLTAQGYLIFADELYERFYGPALRSGVAQVPALPGPSGWLLGAVLLALARRRVPTGDGRRGDGRRRCPRPPACRAPPAGRRSPR